MRMRKEAFTALAYLALMAGGGFLPAISVSGEPGKPDLRILAPANGAGMSAGRVLLIGKAAGKETRSVEIDVNGKGKQSVAVKRGGFFAPVSLSNGKNVIRVSGVGASATLEVNASAKGAYAYHASVEKCAGCHGPEGKGYDVGPAKDKVCYLCHARMDGKKMAHGPMGSGECTACHDPHGSPNKAFMVARPDLLCVSCHDQKTSAAHIAKSRGKACTGCHEPHSSDKVNLLK